MRISAAVAHIVDQSFRRRSTLLLLAVSLVIGAVYAWTMLPISVIAGTAPFWRYPHGTVPGSENDMGNYLVAYLNLVQTPWQLPLLFAPNVAAPAGTNIFWLDAVPWVLLVGRLIFTTTGVLVNPFGLYLFACFALPGVAMTGLLATAGQRNLVAAIAGTALAGATPYLLFRWGHIPLLGQFWIVVAFSVYLSAIRNPHSWKIAATWLALLSLLLLTNIYLFVMAGTVWAAAALQRRLDGTISNGRLLSEAVAALVLLIAIMLVTGILSPDLRSVSSGGFGTLSMNLVSPIVPQMSGLVPPLRNYRVGIFSQYEGFGYLGAGVLLLIFVSLPAWFAWLRRNAKAHVVLICLLCGLLLFALSNRIYVGSHLVFELPLPESVTEILGTFRSSGRFFWPIGYALAAGSIVLVLRRFRPGASLALLAAASVLQVVDVEPLREAVAATTEYPLAAAFDRQRAEQIVARSQSVMVFPSFGCVNEQWWNGLISRDAWLELRRADIEMQLIAARDNLPINSAYNARLRTDCVAEDAAIHQPLRPGTLYVYLTQFTPGPDQLGGHAAADVCSTLDWLHYCLIPPGSP
jgi:Family of unknown function (DUF6311)